MSLQFYNRDGSPMIPNEGETDTDLLMRWSTLFGKADNRIVRQSRLLICGYVVSTVFLGLNHNFDPSDERPLIFETMVFAAPKEGERFRKELFQVRYATEKEAKIGHGYAVWTYFLIGIRDKIMSIFQ